MSDLNYPQRHKKPDNPKVTTFDLNAKQRIALAIKLRSQGLTWDEVAEGAGYGSKGAAHHAVSRELQRTITGNVEEMRREEAMIIEALYTRIETLATQCL